MKEYKYVVMDGRAAFDIESATILMVCSTLEDARSDAKMFGDDSVIVRYEVNGKQLINPEIVE